ncbi:MAG: TM2 domain-containing protein [Actinomycetales bacterium]
MGGSFRPLRAPGVSGIDRFYTGRVGLGILKLLTSGGGFIWWIIDAILFGTQSGRDRQGRRIA